MSRAGRQNGDITRGERQNLALLAAKTDACFALGHTQNFVRVAVKMMIIEDSVAPAVRPAIRREFILEITGKILRSFQRGAVDDKRKLGIVRDSAVILEPAKLG